VQQRNLAAGGALSAEATVQPELREYVDLLTELTAKVALDGALLVVGRAAEVASGWPMERLIGSSFVDGPWWTFADDVHQRVRDAFARACHGERVSYRERIFILGGVHVIQFSLVPALDAVGSTRYVIAEGHDITAQVAAEEMNARDRRRLDAANRELETFNYSVSHDVRAPVRRITELVGALEEDIGDGLSQSARQSLQMIRREASRVATLAADLLVLSRVDRHEIAVQDVDLSQIAAETFAQLARLEPRRLVETVVTPGIVVRTDEGLVRIVIENILSNAWKFTSGREVGRIEFRREGSEWFVRDNGVGFDPAKAGMLFVPFRRLHSEREFEGSGVGLATVRRIVERLGGTVRAEGAVDRGATFRVSLP